MKSRRTISLSPDSADLLRTGAAGRATGDPVLVNVAGRPIRNNTLWTTHWLPAIEKAQNPDGKPDPRAPWLTKRPQVHDLRHTHASRMLAVGMDMLSLSRRLGHETYATTDARCSHRMPAQQLHAAGVVARRWTAPLPEVAGEVRTSHFRNEPGHSEAPTWLIPHAVAITASSSRAPRRLTHRYPLLASFRSRPMDPCSRLGSTRAEGARMDWVPNGMTLTNPGGRAAYSATNIEQTAWPSCPAKIGVDARRARVLGEAPDTRFDDLLIAAIKAAIDALVAGRHIDDETALARSRATYASRHQGIRNFLDAAIGNYFDFLESRESLVGPLQYRDFSHRRAVTADFDIRMWAPVYTNAHGGVEIHRLRYGEAHDEVTEWATATAWIAGHGSPVTVIDFGLTDGLDSVLIDAAPADAVHPEFEASVLPRLQQAHSAVDPAPGSSCGECRLAPVCPAPVQVDMFGGLSDSTPNVRSLSSHGLRLYRTCPAAWYLHAMRLPRTPSSGEALERGSRVHAWIAQRHTAGESCADTLSLDTTVSPGDQPLLRWHAEHCDQAGRTSLAIEETLVAWDRGAQVVLYLKPDELLMDQNRLVLREIKTTDKATLCDSQAVARDEYSDVLAWWLAILQGGLCSHYGASMGSVELEILTPLGGATYRFDTDDPASEYIIQGWLIDTPDAWMSDSSWRANPGPQCATCDVRRWCDHRDDRL